MDFSNDTYLTSKQHTYISPNNCEIMLERNADIITPEYLELSFVDSTIDNLSNVKNLVFNMSIGGVLIQQFPLGLLINLDQPNIVDNKMYINLNFNILFGEIKILGLKYHDVFFYFDKCESLKCISSYGIHCKLTYLHGNEKLDLVTTEYTLPIQQLSVLNVKSENSTRYDISYLPFYHISKGFFIECDDVNNISDIKLTLDNNEKFTINKTELETKCIKFSQNILYFPFNYEKQYTDISEESFEGGINFSKINKTDLLINFDTPTNNVKIYNLHANTYRQLGGTGGTLFNKPNNTTYKMDGTFEVSIL